MIQFISRMLVAAVISAAWIVAAAGPGGAAPFRLITTDLVPQLVPNSVMDLAVRLGYFQREGVEVELVRVQQTPSAVAALRAGDGDMANIGVDAALQLVARDQMPLKAVISPNKSLPFLIAGKDTIRTLADLEGRSFGIGRVGSLDQMLSSRVLASEGVNPDRIDIVALGQPNVRAQALAAGRIDATTMSIGVWLSMPDKAGLAVLVPCDDYFAAAPVVNKVNVVPDAVLAAKRDQVAAVVRALIAISRDFAEKPALWVDAMAVARPDVDRETLRMLARSFTGSWSVNGGMSRDELQATEDWAYVGPDFDGLRKVPLDEWVDTSFVAAVLQEDGIVPEYDLPGY